MKSSNTTGKNFDKWMPNLFLSLRNYNGQLFLSDLISGITVGLVALPLAMAFGIASGVTPQAGIYTAVIAGFIISALGGSKVQIGGPTGAFVVIVASIIAKYGFSGLLVVTLMAGLILIVMGLTGMGEAVKFIPRPVTIGFTNGIAVLIASTQIKDFLGLKTGPVPSAFLPRMRLLFTNLNTIHWPTFAIAAIALGIIVFWPKVNRRIPGSIVALFLGTAAVAVLKIPVETIGSKFGGIPTGFPSFHLPSIHPEYFVTLFPSALTVALLAAVESLLSAVVADNMSGTRHNSNVELVAQGLANLASPLFGGIPATGAIARTATNIRSGAKTPVSGMMHALTLVIILLIGAPLARFVPLAVLASVLFIVSYNMGEWREIGAILRLSKADKAVWLTTFVLTVLADLTVAVEVGMILALLLYIHRIAQTTTVEQVTQEYIQEGKVHILQDKTVPPYVSILRIHGPFLFGTTDKLLGPLDNIDALGEIVILRLRNMTALDATGLHALQQLAAKLKGAGRTLLLSGAREQPAELLKRAEFVEHVGKDNILPNAVVAIERAQQIHEENLLKEPSAPGLTPIEAN